MIRIYRFHDVAAIASDFQGMAYLTPETARELGESLIVLANNCQTVPFASSQYSNREFRAYVEPAAMRRDTGRGFIDGRKLVDGQPAKPLLPWTVVGIVDHAKACDAISAEVWGCDTNEAWEAALAHWTSEAESDSGLHGESGYSLDSQDIQAALLAATHRGHNLSA